MITAEEARKMSEKKEDEILKSPRFKYIFTELEDRIKRAAARGDRMIEWWDYSDPKMDISYNGDDAFKRKLYSMGYNFSYTDKGHYQLSW